MHPYHHAASSARHFGGRVEDYIALHNWFDATKAGLADARHRSIRHHAYGIDWARSVFGDAITNSDGHPVSVIALGQQHVREDLGVTTRTAGEWLGELREQPWMIATGEDADHPEVAAWFEAPVITGDGSWQLRALRYHAQGIFWCEEELGIVLSRGDRVIPTRVAAEAQVQTRLGRIPTLGQWLRNLPMRQWMSNTSGAMKREARDIDAFLTEKGW